MYRSLKHWFYLASLIRLGYDIYGLTASIMYVVAPPPVIPGPDDPPTTAWKMLVALRLFIWIIGCINGLFLLIYDTLLSDSILGTVVAQQALSATIIILNTTFIALTYNIKLTDKKALLYPYKDVPFFAISAGCSLLISLILLSNMIVLANRTSLSISTYWFTNASDIAAMEVHLPPKPSWRGTRRRTVGAPVIWIVNVIFSMANATRKFLVTSFFRRVSPVETATYALLHNTFAISALVLLGVRAITLITQFQSEDFRTRRSINQCSSEWNTCVLVGSPDQNVTTQISMFDNIEVFAPPVYHNCKQMDNLADWNSYGSSYMFKFYSCSKNTDPLLVLGGTEKVDLGTISYTITTSNHSSYELVLWFREGSCDTIRSDDDPEIGKIMQLTPPMRPSQGMYEVFSRTEITRRFIVSSGLKDIVTGSQPKYKNLRFHVPARMNQAEISATSPVCQPPDNSSSVVACGILQPSTGLGYYPEFTENQLNINLMSGRYCEAIEDYRQSSAFDILGSIGGLLALLQGIHIFLFGRPLFWGLFGAKLLTPFGFMGRLATQGFRQRLNDHYNTGPSKNPRNTDRIQDDMAGVIRMNKFLLDYVLDMGPASLTEPECRPQTLISEHRRDSTAMNIQQHPNETKTNYSAIELNLREGDTNDGESLLSEFLRLTEANPSKERL